MVWRFIETLSSLLEEDERQSALGDIHERGADVRALFDLAALVVVRQLQDWQFWFPWSMTMLVPAFGVASFIQGIPSLILRLDALGTDMTRLAGALFLSVPILAWGIGFSLGSIGKRRAAIVLPLLASFGVLFPGPDYRALAKQGPVALGGVAATILLAAILPCLAVFVRGVRGISMNSKLVVALGAAALLGISELVPKIFAENYRGAVIFLPLGLWPVVYALRHAGPSRKVIDAD